jgi:Fe-Mn family superoxide dismutase
MLELPKLPYAKTALAPHISAETLGFHHGKHHKTYVETTNKLIKGTPLDKLPLVELVRKAKADPKQQKLFNNAAQVWNHNFYWKCMTPKGGGKPAGEIGKRIQRDFGGFAEFSKAFEQTGTEVFGTGYVWLVARKGKLQLIGLPDAETPITGDDIPILCADVWEHAYYLDYQNRRPDHLKVFLKNLVNWKFAEQNLSKPCT